MREKTTNVRVTEPERLLICTGLRLLAKKYETEYALMYFVDKRRADEFLGMSAHANVLANRLEGGGDRG